MTLTKAPQKRRPTTSHKKRQGQHHKQSHHYVKTYWPYLPILVVALCGFVLNGMVSTSHHDVLGYATNVSGQVLLADTNSERAKDNEPTLALSAILSEAAQSKANDMANRNYWSHVTPDGKQPWSFIDTTGYKYSTAGENLAYGFGTSDQVISAWMQSQEHRDNMLNKNYQEVGFATANAENYRGEGPATIVVALYAKPTGMIITAFVEDPTKSVPVNIASTSQHVSRLQTVTSNTWLQMSLAALCGAAVVLFILRHGRAWHRTITKGEKFFIHHPFVDIFLISAIVMWFLLSPIAGTIR